MNEPLADEIRNARFDPVRLREGYDMGEVDWFLDQLEDKVKAGEPIDDFVAGARFRAVRLREAYDMGEVDRFLGQVVQWSHEASGSDQAAVVGDRAVADRVSPPDDVRRPAAIDAMQQTPSVVQEVRSPLRRLFGRRRG